jgi:hypothetical protein
MVKLDVLENRNPCRDSNHQAQLCAVSAPTMLICDGSIAGNGVSQLEFGAYTRIYQKSLRRSHRREVESERKEIKEHSYTFNLHSSYKENSKLYVCLLKLLKELFDFVKTY